MFGCLDIRMAIKHRKPARVIDNLQPIPTFPSRVFRSITTKCFLQNVTSILELLDQGDIMNVRSNYRKLLFWWICTWRRWRVQIEYSHSFVPLQINVGWREKKIIKICFHHAGFRKQTETNIVHKYLIRLLKMKISMKGGMLQGISSKMKLDEKLSFDEYTAIYYALVLVNNMPERELISHYWAKEEIASSSDQKHEERVPKLPRIKKMFQVLLRFQKVFWKTKKYRILFIIFIWCGKVCFAKITCAETTINYFFSLENKIFPKYIHFVLYFIL